MLVISKLFGGHFFSKSQFVLQEPIANKNKSSIENLAIVHFKI